MASEVFSNLEHAQTRKMFPRVMERPAREARPGFDLGILYLKLSATLSVAPATQGKIKSVARRHLWKNPSSKSAGCTPNHRSNLTLIARHPCTESTSA